MQNGFLFLLCVPFIIMMIFFLYTRRGAAWVMGGSIVWSGEEHVVYTNEFLRARDYLQLHEIESEQGPADTLVGLEFRAKTAVSLDLRSASLTLTQARALREDLAVALSATT